VDVGTRAAQLLYFLLLRMRLRTVAPFARGARLVRALGRHASATVPFPLSTIKRHRLRRISMFVSSSRLLANEHWQFAAILTAVFHLHCGPAVRCLPWYLRHLFRRRSSLSLLPLLYLLRGLLARDAACVWAAFAVTWRRYACRLGRRWDTASGA